MRRRMLLIYLLVLIIPQGYSQNLGFIMEGNRQRVSMPFELHNNLIIIPVMLNEQLPLKFILDTGVRTAILVDKDYSDLLNLKYSKKYTLYGLGDKKIIDAYITTNVSLHIPGIQGEGHAMLVLERDLMELKNYLGTDVHGILGYELFSRFVVEIDYVNELLTLTEPSKFKPKKRFSALPMKVEDTKPHIYATLQQNDGSEVELKLMVDSGSSQSIFIEKSSDSVNLQLPEKTIYTNVGRGLAGNIKGYVGKMPALKINEYVLEDIIVNYPDKNTFFDSLKFTERNGTIGGEVLSRFKVIFNFPGEILYLRKNSDFNDEFTYNLSGLTVKATGPFLKTFEISEVRKESTADKAGVKEGDTILKINGYNAEDIKLSRVIGELNSKSGRKVKLVLKRKNKVIKKDFRLKDVI